MSGSSYFSDWLGCLNCDFVHGARSAAEVSIYKTIITSVSQALCTSTPTASAAALFAFAGGNDVSEPSSVTLTDLYPSETALSLYFTASGTQGAGAITGSATGATGTAGGSVITTGTSSVAETTTSGAKITTGLFKGSTTDVGTASSSSSSAGVAPTGVVRDLLGMALGGVVMAAL